MKTAIALLAVLAWAALYVGVEGGPDTQETYIDNQNSQWTIDVTIDYSFDGSPGFQNRQLGPGNSDHDEYQAFYCNSAMDQGNPTPVNVHVHINAASVDSTINVACDHSLVFVDSKAVAADIEVYLSQYGGPTSQPVGNLLAIISPD